MLYEWLVSHADQLPFLEALRSITFRTALATLFAFFACLLAGPRYIAWLKGRGILERADQSDSRTLGEHIKTHAADKSLTPTMGGALILGVFLCASMLFAQWTNIYVLLCLFVTLAFGALGWLDDARKLLGSQGLSRRAKMLGLTAVAAATLACTTWFALTAERQALLTLHFPVVKDASIHFYGAGAAGIALLLLFEWFILVGSSNAVNITDGLDGLAAGCSLLSVAAVSLFCYAAGHSEFAAFLKVPYVQGAGEITVLGGALLGGLLGFLWFNAHPAQVFMGDTGSLAIGGFLGFAAIVSRQELVLPIVSSVFVIEAGSSWLQITSCKLFGKRPLPIAPIHHIWQQRGMPESKLVARFWIFSTVSAVFGLALLKMP